MSADMELKKNYSSHPKDSEKLMAIAGIMKERDRYTGNHGQRVSEYSKRLARCIGLSGPIVDQIGMGGMLHDIGKVFMSDHIFSNKSNRLSKEMMAEVRLHPSNGVMLVKHINFLKPVLKYILLHHERLDGSGYPFGLKSEDLPLGAQIISVADCFDAITTDRPYQKGRKPEEAFACLKASSGRILSRQLVYALIADVKENGMVLTDN